MAQVSVKNLNILGLLKEESDLSATKKAVGKYARAAFAKKKKAICPDHQIVRWKKVKMSKSGTFVRERGIRAEAWERNCEIHNVYVLVYLVYMYYKTILLALKCWQ